MRISREEYSKRFKNKDLAFFIKNAQVGYNDLYCLLFVYSKFTQGDTDLIKGGAKEVIDCLKNNIIKNGGKIYTSTPVEEIIVENDKACGIIVKGSKIYSDYVICAVDSIYALEKLLKGKYSLPLLEKMNNDYEHYPLLSGYQITFLLENKYKNIFDVSNVIKFDPIKVGDTYYDNALLRTYFYDKDSFSDGKTTICHISFNQNKNDYLYWNKLNNDEYIKQKEIIANEFLKQIYSLYPEIKDNIDIIDTFTPLTVNKFTNSTLGAYMSFSITGINIPHVFDGRIPGLDNFVLANQFIMMPVGLPNAMIMGLLSIDRLLK